MNSSLHIQLMHRVKESSAARSGVDHISRSHARESFIGNYLGGFSCRREGLGRPYSSLLVSKRGYKREGEGLFTKAYRDRTKSSEFKQKRGQV